MDSRTEKRPAAGAGEGALKDRNRHAGDVPQGILSEAAWAGGQPGRVAVSR